MHADDHFPSSLVRAVLVEERDVLAVVLRQVLDKRLLALGENLLDLRVDLVPFCVHDNRYKTSIRT